MQTIIPDLANKKSGLPGKCEFENFRETKNNFITYSKSHSILRIYLH